MSDIRFNNWKHQSGTGGVVQDAAGKVGIGSTQPSSMLDVGGDGKFTGVVTATSFSGSGANLTNLPAGQLTGTIPDARFPATLPAVSGANLTGIAAGATGGGSDQIFYENGQTVTTNYTITNGKNAMSAGPITINSGVTVTVGSGETYTIV